MKEYRVKTKGEDGLYHFNALRRKTCVSLEDAMEYLQYVKKVYPNSIIVEREVTDWKECDDI